MNEKDIRITKPRQDCKFCVVRNFVDFQDNDLDEYYAECTNQVKTQGLSFIDITLEGNPLLAETTCRNCKEYESNNQLNLFEL